MKKPTKNLKTNVAFLKTFPELIKQKNGICKIKCCQMKCLREIIVNLLIGNIPLRGLHRVQLKEIKKHLFAFADKKTPIKVRRQILNSQTGAGGVLLPVFLSGILPLVLDFIARKS